MGFFAAVATGIGIYKTGKKLWYSVKKPVPKRKPAKTTNTAMMQPVGGPKPSLPQAGGYMSMPSIGKTALSTIPAIATGNMTPLISAASTMVHRDGSQLNNVRPLVLDAKQLGIKYQAPKGYVIVRDPAGNVFGVDRAYAIRNRWWKPARKPPIKASEWKHIKDTKRIEKKLKKMIKKI